MSGEDPFPIDALYLVLDVAPDGDCNLLRATFNGARAREMARNIEGVAIGLPVAYSIADFREGP